MLGILCKSTVIITIFLTATLCYAEDYYLFIEKTGRKPLQISKKDEVGHSDKGDIIAITPATPQYEPTPSEKNNYKIVVVDLTKDERDMLLESEYLNDDTDGVIIKARKRKVDFENLNIKKTKDRIEKNSLLSNVTVKP